MTFPPKLIFWLTFLATIGQGTASGTVHLTGLVPPELLPYVTGWIGFSTFCVMSFLTLASARAGIGVGPLAPPPTVADVQKVMAAAQAAKVNGSIK